MSIKRIVQQLTCLHIYDVDYVVKCGSIYAAEVCKYCGKTKIIC